MELTFFLYPVLILHFERFVSLVGTAESSINGEKERIKIWNGDYEFITGSLPPSCFLHSRDFPT